MFDFDGLLLDTETPLFEAWTATYEHFGVEPLTLEAWQGSIGLHHDDPARFDPLVELRAAIGPGVSDEEIHAHRRGIRDDLLEVEVLRPGAEDLLDAATDLGLEVAIASSSPPEWVHDHLARRGQLTRFAAISCAGDGVPGKPDPATYTVACSMLGVAPGRALAFEDSINGVLAAKAAGLHCVAVPNGITMASGFEAADHVVATLAAVDLRRGAPVPTCAAFSGCPLGA